MKKVSLLFFAWAGSLALGYAQNASAVLDANEVRSVIFPKNGLFWDGVAGPSYEVPAGSGNHSLFVGNLWLMGQDANGLLHGYYNRFGFGEADTLPGPLMLTTGTTTQAIADQYKRVWKINQWEIDLLMQAQGNGQLASGAYVAPPDIEEWPANPPAAGYGNHLAPFHDADGDGLYDIHDGDYPIIKGEQMVYFILNDRGTGYASGVDVPLQTGLEIHVSVYGCKKDGASDSTGIINYVTFLEYEVYNRGVIILNNAYLGFNTDADIGYALDDHMGTHVDANAIYFVNGDAVDAQGANPGAGQYGTDFPVQSIQFLEAPQGPPGMEDYPMAGSMHYSNSSGATGDPASPLNVYNFLRTYWNNGAKMVYGGTGFPGTNGATTLEARYMFPGESDPGNVGTSGVDPGFAWSQANPCPTCLPEMPNDQRALATSHPFTLAPGDSVRIVLGLVTTFAPDSSTDGRVALNRAQNKLLKQWYGNGDLPCVMSQAPLETPEVSADLLSVYPNPTPSIVYVSGSGIHAGTPYALMDVHGRTLRLGKGQAEGVIQLSVDDLADGIYFIRLQGNGRSHIVKFVKKQ